MAHRLRLYFGSGRSNTAPELEVLEGDSGQRQQEDGPRGVTFRVRTPPVSGTPRESPAQPFSGPSEPALKRSSSMFIPQLAHLAEPRATTTKSSTMQISLQRSDRPGRRDSNGLGVCGNDCDDDPPPCYTPPGPAPAYTEPGTPSEYPRAPPPPYCSPEVPGIRPAELSDLPQRLRVFGVGSNGHGGSLTPGRPTGLSVGGIHIRRNSLDGPEVQRFRILPYAGSGTTTLGWVQVRQQSGDMGGPPAVATNGGGQRLVFQLQQNQSQDQDWAAQRAPPSQEERTNPGLADSGDGRVLRYPKIRLERTSPPQQSSGPGGPGEGDEENPAQPRETPRTEPEDPSKGCTFKIRRETPRRQPHFRICFSPNGSRGHNVNFDHDFTQINPKVNSKLYMETSVCDTPV